MKAMSKTLGYKDALRFGSEDSMKEILSVKKGNVTPFALINDDKVQLQVILDSRILEEEALWFHPLSCDASMKVNAKELLVFLGKAGRNPVVFDFVSNTVV